MFENLSMLHKHTVAISYVVQAIPELTAVRFVIKIQKYWSLPMEATTVISCSLHHVQLNSAIKTT